MITLTLKEQPNVPLEAEVLSPDAMAALANDAIRALPVYLGKKLCRVDDFFAVEGEASDELKIRGDARKVKWIGRGMTRGRINIVGNAGQAGVARQGLRGGAADVEAHPGPVLLLDHRGTQTELRGADGRGVAAGARAEDHDIKMCTHDQTIGSGGGFTRGASAKRARCHTLRSGVQDSIL